MKKNITARILIVDDVIYIRTFNSVLKDLPYEVEGAASANECLYKIKNKKYDIIFLDLQRTNLRTLDLLDNIFKLDKSISVVVMSIEKDIDTAIQSIKKGAVDYLIKPLDLNRILLTIHNILDSSTLYQYQAKQFDGFNLERFNKVVSFYLQRNGISRQELGIQSKIPNSTLNNIFVQKSIPRIEHILAISKTLKIPFELLLGSSDISEDYLENHWNNKNINFEGLKIFLPDYIKTSIHQYLLTFGDFVKGAKGEKIILKISEIEEGLLIYDDFDEVKKEQIGEWLKEYMGFIKQKTGEFQVNFEVERTDIQADIVIAQLENQVNNLINNLRLKELELNYIKRENNLLIEQKDLLKEITQLSLIPHRNNEKESKNDLKDLLANGYCKKVLEILKGRLEGEDVNSVYIVSANYSNIIASYESGVLSETDKSLNLQKVNIATLSLIDKLTESPRSH